MTISFYRNSSDNNKIGKVLTLIKSVDATLRDECSIMSPDILIAANISEFTNCNYMYIPAWGRYYYIDGIVSVRNGLTEVTGNIDVLETYKESILNCEVITDRNEFVGDHYIPDERDVQFAKPLIDYYPFPDGFPNANDTVVLVASGGSGRVV